MLINQKGPEKTFFLKFLYYPCISKLFHAILLLFYMYSTYLKIKIQQDVAFMPFVLLPKSVSDSSAYFEQTYNKEKHLGIHTEAS